MVSFPVHSEFQRLSLEMLYLEGTSLKNGAVAQRFLTVKFLGEILGAQINKSFLVVQRQKLITCGALALLEHSPEKIKFC